MIDRYNYSYKKKKLCLTTTILHIINHLATNIRECKELYRYMYFFFKIFFNLNLTKAFITILIIYLLDFLSHSSNKIKNKKKRVKTKK